MEIKKLGVVGAGQMGAGIAQVAATSGLDVVVTDVAQTSLDKGQAAVEKSLGRLVKKEKMSQEEANEALARIQWSLDLTQHQDRQLVVEAVTENEDLKGKIFRDLDALMPSDAILATNTSSISVTRLASQTQRADRFIGMHFMNPVPIMKLVEVIRGIATSDDTFAKVKSLAETMGKVTTMSRDYAGFLANRILMPMINEAFYTLMEGVGSAEDIDTTMKLGMNHPMGPLTLADFIGLDTCLYIMEVLHEGLGDSKYRPCPLLRQHVDAGWLGRKTKRGVFDYSEA